MHIKFTHVDLGPTSSTRPDRGSIVHISEWYLPAGPLSSPCRNTTVHSSAAHAPGDAAVTRISAIARLPTGVAVVYSCGVVAVGVTEPWFIEPVLMFFLRSDTARTACSWRQNKANTQAHQRVVNTGFQVEDMSLTARASSVRSIAEDGTVVVRSSP